jgi:phosphate transport system substrate-binding protein
MLNYRRFVLSTLMALSTSGLFSVGFSAEELKDYQKVEGVTGTLKSVGSDTMNNVMALWTEGFQKFYPGVKIEVEGKGSATAPTALIAGTSQLGPMSRPMKKEEIESFKSKNGYEPVGVKTCLDVLAVYVHKDNPIKSLSLEQVDAIFSKTRKAGGKSDIVTWGDLGLTGEWATKPIQTYGRNSASGTYGYFKEHALAKGDFKDSVKEQPGSAAVVQAVTNDKFGIGYSGIGYITPGVKAVDLSSKGGAPIKADAKHAYDGTYPLGRFLLVYVNKSPTTGLDPLRREFLKFVLSAQGQEAVEKDGYIKLPAATIKKELDTLVNTKG